MEHFDLRPLVRVLIISNMFPSARSFLGTFIARQIESLEAQGVKVSAVVKRNPGPAGYLPFWVSSLQGVLLGQYDIIHAHYGFHSALLPLWLGRGPLVTTFHGSDALVEPWRNSLYHRFQREVVARSDHIITASKEIKEVLEDRLAADPRKITVLPCGVNTRLFAPRDQSTCRRLTGISPDGGVVLFIGRSSHTKGTDIVWALARRLPRVTFLLAGDRMPPRLPENCLHLGAVPNEELSTWINVSDLVLIPSRREGTPVALLETLSCGVPVVASSVGGIPDVMTHGKEGLLVPREDVDGFEQCILCLLERPQERKTMGEKGRARIKQFYNAETVARKLVRVYGAVIGKTEVHTETTETSLVQENELS